MIRADDLVKWTRDHAINDSMACLGGWIRAKELLELAEAVAEADPFDYRPKNERKIDGRKEPEVP